VQGGTQGRIAISEEVSGRMLNLKMDSEWTKQFLAVLQ
jgi:hypothetical protein